MLKGVLFDFDGVVVDSMEQHYEAWAAAFAAHGVSINRHGFFLLEGQGMETIANILAKQYGLNSTGIITIIKGKVEHYYAHHELRFYKYFLTMLNNLKKRRTPMAVVTGGHRERVHEIINTHLANYFDVIISIDDVNNGKPHPEPFLAGAKGLGLSPDECIVVENAPLGIQAAKAGKCPVIAVKTTLGVMELAQADFIAVDFKEVEFVINRWMGHFGTA